MRAMPMAPSIEGDAADGTLRQVKGLEHCRGLYWNLRCKKALLFHCVQNADPFILPHKMSACRQMLFISLKAAPW